MTYCLPRSTLTSREPARSIVQKNVRNWKSTPIHIDEAGDLNLSRDTSVDRCLLGACLVLLGRRCRVGLLGLPHLIIKPLQAQQTLVRPFLDYTAVAQDDDVISFNDGSQSKEAVRVGNVFDGEGLDRESYRWAMNILVRAFSSNIELMLFIRSSSVWPSRADV